MWPHETGVKTWMDLLGPSTACRLRGQEVMDVDNALLLSLGELVSQEISASQLLARLVDVIVSALHADRATIYLLDPERGELVSVAAHLPELKELRVPLQQGVAGYVARTERMVNTSSSSDGVPFWPRVDEETGYTTRNMIAGPMYASTGSLLGVIQVLNKRGDGVFSASDERLFGALCTQAGALIGETTLTGDVHEGVLEEDSLAELRGDEPPTALGEQFNRVVGRSAAMKHIYQMINKVAPTQATVLIRGESGTGKSVIARAIHYNSDRRQAPFVSIDATTLPDTLLENELFGHEKGAYTGAVARKAGRVELAQGGTLFLDEIGDLPLDMQGKLLTLLQDQTFHRVGGNVQLRADIRIVTATNRDLEELVGEGQFREDLYYRLRVVQLTMPPLRERGREDLVALIQHFVAKASRRHKCPSRRIRADALQLLLEYSWPGNVRELENCMESAVIFADREITPSTLSLPRPGTTRKLRALSTTDVSRSGHDFTEPGPDTDRYRITRDVRTSPAPEPFVDEPSLRQLEARYIAYLLAQHDGNRSVCARILDIGRNTLIRKIKEYDLDM
jgi:Nif-specific regulatory protein